MFLQYLWGIETEPVFMLRLKESSFYSTYEELKLIFYVFAVVSLCFYSTYEELKPKGK